MAVNKNFVVKNGLEVSTDLILADATTNRVGIGSTIPDYTLQVIGGIGGTSLHVSGFTTSLTALHVGSSGTVFTALGVGGSVGVGTALPAFLLDVVSPVSTGQTALYVKGDARITGDLHVDDFTVDDITIDQLNVTGLSTFAGNIFVGTGATVGFGSTVFFRDNAKIELGDGDDLKIYHDGSNSYIQDVGTGNLYVDASNLTIRNAAGSETQASFVQDGAVSLYHDNAKKFETTASGVIVTGMTTVTGISSFQGNVHITGSLEVAQDLTFNTNVNIIGIATLGTLDTTNFGTIGAGLTVVGNGVTSTTLNVTGVSTFAGVLDANDTTQSSSSTTGAAKFAGGVGVAKNLYVGGGQVTAGILTVTDLRVGTQLAGQTLVGITTILDEDNMASNSAAALVTQQSIKAYVDAQVTASDLDFQGDSGGAQSVDLDSQTFTIAGTSNEIETSSSGQTLTVGLPDDVTIGRDLTVTRNVSIADSIFHTGDTNTALRFPAADTFTVETAGGERLRITSAGFVGVNTDIPGSPLEVNGGSGLDVATFNSHHADGPLINIQRSGTVIGFVGSGKNLHSTTGSVDGLAIRSQAEFTIATGGATERLRIRSDGGVVATGIATFSSTAHLTVPVGTTGQRDSIVANGMIRYNTTLNSYEGYGNGAWGGLGGGTEIDVSVSSTSATNLTTFAHASYRSAQFRVQITQGSAYQVGKYLLIHDGTTVTVVEESAIATGDMLGSVSSVINGSNVEVKITMNSASSATVTTIVDKITV